MNRTALPVVISLLAVSAFAQKADPFDLAISNVLLLQVKSVQKEVGMTEAQRAKLNTYADAFNKNKDAFMKSEKTRSITEGKNFKPNEAKLRSMFGEFRGQVLSQLSAKQAKRLSQLTLQEVGMAAILDPNVAKKLALTPKQLDQLRAAYDDGIKRSSAIEQAAVAPIRKDFQGKDPNDKKVREQFNARMSAAQKSTAPALEKVKADTRAKFKSILSAQQRTAWNALTGPVFNG